MIFSLSQFTQRNVRIKMLFVKKGKSQLQKNFCQNIFADAKQLFNEKEICFGQL